MKAQVIQPRYDHYIGLPPVDTLFNPLTDIPPHLKEKDELTEFYKLCNEFYSPEFGIKYLLQVDLFPFQMAIIRAILGHKFPMILLTRGGGKTFLLAVYGIYHAIMYPGSRIVLVSASFRQSKLIFAEIDRIYRRSPLLQQIADDAPRISTDHCKFRVCGSEIKALPLGTGDKIRGERGHVILADEFNSIPIEIFDVVVRGFGATESDPWKKTRDKLIRQYELDSDAPQDDAMTEIMLAEGNKIILSGTAGFKGGTFYKLFSQYSKIISHGMKGRAADFSGIFDEGELDDEITIDCADYCISRFTYLELPMGMQDVKVIQNAKQTMPGPLFEMEYLTHFADDTLGFFKARDVEAATSRAPNGFSVRTRGDSNRHYVIGVDPARTTDRFAIVVVELGSPCKVVYVWTCQNKPFSYATTHLRSLLDKFNTIAIAMDEGGGGFAVEELLNLAEIRGAQVPIYRYDDDRPEAEQGNKILYMFPFSSNWIDDANTLLQKNIEDRIIMFPMQIDASNSDGAMFVERDDILFEVLEMKKELVSIEVTHTKSGKKHFDLAPPDPKKDMDGIVRHKDRYSALLLANFIASRMNSLNYDEKAMARDLYEKNVGAMGGWLEDIVRRSNNF